MYQGNDCRYYVVERRNNATLISIIKRECARGSVIHSNEWAAYGCSEADDYRHSTSVNHQENYVNPDTGAHTQGLECSWLDSKVAIMKKKKGVALYLLQGYLDHYCWKMWCENEPDLFVAFLKDVRGTTVNDGE